MTKKHASAPPRQAPGRLSTLETVILGVFFLSGASALVYEVVWSRELTNVFGGSAFAIATVLAAFMAGLALGSTVFGRLIDRRGHPLLVYAALEAGIAVWALILPWLLDILNPLYAAIYQSWDPGFYTLSLVRFVLCFFLLLVPTTLMGGTLPVLGKLLLKNWRGLGTRSGLLYGANTLGAVLGTAAGGFFLLPTLGLRGSTWVAVIINLAVALFAVLLAQRLPYSTEPSGTHVPSAEERRQSPSSGLRKAVLWVYAASGFAALAYEVAWSKTLSMILGTTTYAFTSMLATFLLGLALGALLFARLADRYGRPENLLALVQASIPVLALLTIPVMGHLPQWFVDGFPSVRESWTQLELYRIFLAGSTMFFPALLMGGTFPLVTRAYVKQGETGRDLGNLYAANTIGAILGSFLAGFVLIPLLGRQNTILAATFVNIGAALLLVIALRGTTTKVLRWGLAGVALLLVPTVFLGLKKWDPVIMASGAYIYAEKMSQFESIKTAMAQNELLFYDEATEATVSVWHTEHTSSLRTNGKVEASSHGDMITQRMISHLPVFYHQGDVHQGLMIGLASGISVGSMLLHDYDKVETIELMPSMVEAARYFDDYNYLCMENPRHELILNDGRNHLLLTDRTYDVICSEPSNPWIAGVSSLFTREFFAIVQDRLNPGGIFVQWVQTYQFNDADLKSVLATIQESFPYVHLWQGETGDLILIASMDALALDLDRVQDLLQGPVGEDIENLGIMPLGQMLSYFVTDEKGIAEFTKDWSQRVTDDNLYLEYSIPRHMFDPGSATNVLRLEPYAKSPFAFLKEGSTAPASLKEETDRYRRTLFTCLRSVFGAPLPPRFRNPGEALEEALREAPNSHAARTLLSISVNEDAISAYQAGNFVAAKNLFARAAQIGNRTERALALNNLGAIAYGNAEYDSARALWEQSLALEPNYVTISYNLALVYGRRGDHARAAEQLRSVVDLSPSNATAHNNLAFHLVKSGSDLEDAEKLARRAVALDRDPNFRQTLGLVLLKREKWKDSESVLERVVEERPDDLQSLLYLGEAHAGLGKIQDARTAFDAVIQRSSDADLKERARDALKGLSE